MRKKKNEAYAFKDICDIDTYLRSVGELYELIKSKKADKKQLEALSLDISAKLPDGMPINSAGRPSRKAENAAIRITALSKEIDRLIISYSDLKKSIERVFNELTTDEAGALHRYYFLHMKWEEVAEDMNISVRHIYRVKKRALENFLNVIVCHV